MQKMLRQAFWLSLAGLLLGCLNACGPTPRTGTEILVFSKTAGFRHKSIPAGQEMLRKMAKEQNWTLTFSEESSDFSEKNLSRFSVVIFLNTTGDILNVAQQKAFERYIQAGGGFVGVHAASDTEYGWPWYNKLVGAYFNGHPPGLREGDMQIVDTNHPSTAFFGSKKLWKRKDEFYNFKSIYQNEQDGIKPLILVDENSYEGGTNGDFHPMSWYHDFDGGRAFYTNFGHTDATYEEPEFLSHMLGGIQYAIGKNLELSYHKARTELVPEESRFVMEVLATPLNEPMELEVMQNGNILFTERRGRVKLLNPETREIKVVAELDVWTEKEDGLTGIALDPDFENNRYLYLYYAPNTDEAKFQLSRFKMMGDSLLMGSEKVLLDVVVQRQECCHTGGSIEFDAEGNLYLSTGDDTNPFETRYAPINEVANRSPWDAQKSSANPNDLRGKILRIKPTVDGGYTIPEGNLFPSDGSAGRPEIYVMGCRNPYRISIDPKTGFLYWGDVGPDGQVDSTRGPMGYDEVNQARKPGFFGWPYFIADNQPYRDFDFATGKEGDWFDPESPVNNSPNNTGHQNLPPAQKAFIYYPYGESKEFPIVGKGGRNAMAGPVFYQDQFLSGVETFPSYYEGKLFVYDFMRDWIFAVTMNDAGDLVSLEPFLPGMKLSSPMDMEFGPDGAMYILEYGTRWFAENTDARLIRIDYSSKNRAPVPRIIADKTVGAAPFTVNFSAQRSFDHDDGDVLSYSWDFTKGGQEQANGSEATFTYEAPGVYYPKVIVRDQEGNSAEAEMEIRVGNAPPSVDIVVNGNRSFFWDNQVLDYEIKVTDAEDGSLADGAIPTEAVAITYDFLSAQNDPTEGEQGHAAQASASMLANGEALISSSGCIACHGIEEKIVGPAYTDVAKRYSKQADAQAYLIGKILNGSLGVWGENAMPAQQQLSQNEAAQMALYILSLANQKPKPQNLPAIGQIAANKHKGLGEGATYTLRASYTDTGGEIIGPLNDYESLVLRSPKFEAEELDQRASSKVEVRGNANLSFVRFGEGGIAIMSPVDLSGISRLTLRYGASKPVICTIRVDGPEGPVWTELDLPATGSNRKFQTIEVDVEGMTGLHQLYISGKPAPDTKPDRWLFGLDWMYVHPPSS